jgi:hypothetical protein
MPRVLISYLLMAIVLLAANSAAQEISVPITVQVSLITRILMFDRSLQARPNEKIVIGILYQKGVRESRDTEEEFLDAADISQIGQVFGRPIECIAMHAQDLQTLESELDEDSVSVLYVAPLRRADIPRIADLAEKRQMLTITGVPEYVGKGIAVGFEVRGGRSKIVINLSRAKRQGADFSSLLLKLAEIIN